MSLDARYDMMKLEKEAKNMKKRILVWLLCIALLIPLTTVTAYADCAPKPSVNVDVLCAKNVIVTLLAVRTQLDH